MSGLIVAAVPIFVALLAPRLLLRRWPDMDGLRVCLVSIGLALGFDVLWVVVVESGFGRWMAGIDRADPLSFALTVWGGLLVAPVAALARALLLLRRRRTER